MARGSPRLENDDIVILVTGRTGAGKSTFINTLLNEPDHMPVGAPGSESRTTEVDYAVITPGQHSDRCIVIVDTPGFNSSRNSDAETLRKIVAWIKGAFDQDVTLGGIIHLHDISETRSSPPTVFRWSLSNSEIPESDAFPRVVLVTTRWGRVLGGSNHDESVESDLRNGCWKNLIAGGSKVHRFRNTHAKAWEIVNELVGDPGMNIERDKIRKLQNSLKDKNATFISERVAKFLKSMGLKWEM